VSREEALNALIESGMGLRRDDIELGRKLERERIIKNIESRISDLRACSKKDNCQELARLIKSYIPEWTEGEQP
jgi:hypothetical protein